MNDLFDSLCFLAVQQRFEKELDLTDKEMEELFSKPPTEDEKKEMKKLNHAVLESLKIENKFESWWSDIEYDHDWDEKTQEWCAKLAYVKGYKQAISDVLKDAKRIKQQQ